MHKCLVMGGTDLNNYIILFGLIQEPEVAKSGRSQTFWYISFFLCCRIGSGKQVASVIVDDGKDQDDEDDTFVVEDPNAIQNDVDLVSCHFVAFSCNSVLWTDQKKKSHTPMFHFMCHCGPSTVGGLQMALDQMATTGSLRMDPSQFQTCVTRVAQVQRKQIVGLALQSGFRV